MKSLLIVALATLAAATASARPRRVVYEPVPAVPVSGRVLAGYEWRQDAQYDRIDDGVEAGLLTAGEARKLERAQRKIGRTIDRALEDGVLFPHEMAKIDALFAKQDRKIARLTQNRAVAFFVRPAPVHTRTVVVRDPGVVGRPVYAAPQRIVRHRLAPLRVTTGVRVARTF